MSRDLVYRIAAALVALVLAGGQLACSACPPADELSLAAQYRYDYRAVPPGYREPMNTWISSPGLSSFLQRTVVAGGSRALVANYKFKCSPTSECPECLSCGHTIRGYIARHHGCPPEGDMLLQAYVGPGSTVHAMTY
jgi:hypothetical protein